MRQRPVFAHARLMLAACAIMLLLPAAVLADAQPVAIRLGGRDTTVDVFRAPLGPQASAGHAVVIAHGFTRDRTTMTGHGERLAREGFLVAVPDLPYVWHSADNAVALRELVQVLLAGKFGAPVRRIVLVGFSSGGLAALLAADAPGVVGYVGLDPFDRPSRIGLEAARKLQRPAYLVRAPSSFCNAFSIAAPWRDAFPRLAADRVIAEATHCDFESPTDRLCRAACGGTEEARRRAIGEALSDAVKGVLATPAR